MLVRLMKVIDVPRHAEMTALAWIIPLDGDTSKLVASHVELDVVEFFEKVKKIVEMFNAHVINTKVIHNEVEL